MGIKTYNPYTPSRRRTLVVTIRVKSQLDTKVVEIEENTDLSISREIRKTVFQQL